MHETDLQLAQKLGHEPEGVNARSIWLFAAALVATVVLTLLLVWILLAQLVAYNGNEAIAPVQQVPMAADVPNLDSNQILELQQLRQLEADLLDDYQWIDPTTGIARIPIERAMSIVAEKGLAAINAAEAGEAAPATTTTEGADDFAPAGQTESTPQTPALEQSEAQNDQ